MDYNKKKIDVKCTIFSKWKHTSIILTGLFMLQHQGIINLDIDDKRGNYLYSLDDMGIEIRVANKVAYIDVADGYVDDKYTMMHLTNCDYYFKRSFSSAKNEKFGSLSEKMYPLGLNYTVYNKDSAKYQTLPYSKMEYFGKKIISSLTDMKLMNEYYIEDFIKEPNFVSSDKMKVIFMTRLWKNRSDGSSCDDLNQMRIELMTKLHERYKYQFIGGMEDNELSRNMCPNLIVDKLLTNRHRYISTMKQADIGIATTGLHESIGGKFAEYIAASRAIVSEELRYEVPYLEEGKNYLTFSSVDACLEIVDELMNTPDRVFQMKKDNYSFYCDYLSPDKQVLRVLNIMLYD